MHTNSTIRRPLRLVVAMLGGVLLGLGGAVVVSQTATATDAPAGTVVGWGWNGYGMISPPAGLTGVVAVAAGNLHSLALTSDGTVVGWGNNEYGQASPPAGLTSVVAISARGDFSLALTGDGTVVGWGEGPGSVPPAGLAGVTAISAGLFHGLALTGGGTVVGWGNNDYGQASPPAGLTGVVAIAAGSAHSLALKGDGTVVGWGYNYSGEASSPAGLTGVAAIAAGGSRSLALKADGTVVGWGVGSSAPPPGLSGVVAIAAGFFHSVALRSDGTVVGWGIDMWGQVTPPAGLTDVIAISAGTAHNLAVTTADTGPPTLTLPDPITAEATGPGGVVVDYLVTASDAVDPNPTVVCAPASGTVFPLGQTTVGCTAQDAAGNTAAGSFTITVVDTTVPVLHVSADLTAEATGPGGVVVDYLVTATDTVDPNPGVTCAPASATTFPLGQTTVRCTAKDAAGNVSPEGSFTITVADNTPPTLILPPDVIVEASGASGAVVDYVVTATDTVDPNPAVTCLPESGFTFPLGVTTVVCRGLDAAGNASGPASLSVMVVDTTPPTVTAPADVTVTATDPSGEVVTYPPATWQDAVAGTGAATCIPPSGAVFPLGATTVICAATDPSGNTGLATFQITVAYAWSGVLQPVNADGSSIFKAGSTVPVKFALTGASAPVMTAIARLTYAKITDGIEGTVVEALTNVGATAGNLFRYDATTGQYIYNWSTKGLSSGTYSVKISLNDGVFREVRVSLK